MSLAETDQNSVESTYQTTIREELVQTAIKFLQNQNVINTPLTQKQKFLQRKGLTDQEIKVACEKSGAYILHENQNHLPPPLPSHPSFPVHNTQIQVHNSLFDRIKEVLHNVALFSTVVYAVYMFYKKFIRPFLFGNEKKRSIEDAIEDMEKSVNSSILELRDNLASVKSEVDKINQMSEHNTQRQLQTLQSDVSTVKGLLLSRKQFPVANSQVVPPSIPAWQLASVPPDSEQDPKSEELIEIGSGSTSSEPEHATKTSDSSLEIM